MDLQPHELARIKRGVFDLAQRDERLLRKYYRSPAWRSRRAALLAERPICQRCQSRRAKQVHHCSYARLGAELAEDLVALCGWCHMEEHGLGLVAGQHWAKGTAVPNSSSSPGNCPPEIRLACSRQRNPEQFL